MKIAILGFSGSGKSTLAKKLGTNFSLSILHLDTIQFLPEWEVRPIEESKVLVRRFMDEHSNWIIDGNYSGFLQEERLDEADLIIYMNFSRRVCLPRVVQRYMKNKNQTRADMAIGCLEKMDLPFVWWILHEGRTREHYKHYRALAKEYSQKWVELKTPEDVDNFLKKQICSKKAS